MNNTQTTEKRIRLWPGIILAALTVIIRYGLLFYEEDTAIIAYLGGVIGGFLILLWWIFFSRARRFERWFAPVLMIASLFLTSLFLHESISTAMMGNMFIMFAVPALTVIFVIWASITFKSKVKIRRRSMILTIILGSAFWILLRIDGMTGDSKLIQNWRWATTQEEQLDMLTAENLRIDNTDSLFYIKEAVWPGFRGSDRNGIIKGIQIETDWEAYPPEELWRRSLGPACSSFAVFENLVFTQEQRGQLELVTCYDLYSGKPIWVHEDSARFWDSHAGAGPRATPTFFKGKIYATGATGILNVLNAKDGSLIWSADIALDSEVEHSGWGYCASPIVTDSLVITAAVGKLLAYELETGTLRWKSEDGGDGYSSPQVVIMHGRKQVLLSSADGLVSLDPGDGSILWQYSWEVDSRIIQPALSENGDIILTHSSGKGLRRISVVENGGMFSVKDVWSTNALRANFNDMVIHKGHAYGYEGMRLVCVDLKDGSRKWKKGRYGGQLLLLADQDLLIVLTEKGEIALVKADPNQLTELFRMHAIEGKTWNHPVLANNILIVRNLNESVAYKLLMRK